MANREEIVEIFSNLRNFADNDIHPVVSPENWNVYSKLHDLIDRAEEDALALLKEQEAKVLTLDQLKEALDTVVWLEKPVSENLADGYSLTYRYKHGYMFFDSPFGDNPSQDRLEYSEYGKSWRCWNKRPTDEQRQTVKWE